ncbi:Actin, alpha sarcomeric/cardiac [Heterocephalus glaber]|uniref:Actin, alpha sarcomeric/cardiac n=1 Tax=Heterocephalus glaber TaxID=10181 RepID=G5BSS9_HETGA|nr:Actin, alpha sarcomeric/cardiac [Heterocephalus glaber]
MDRVLIICDYGSGFSKVGFAGKEALLAVFPTILGKLGHDIWHHSFYQVRHTAPEDHPLMVTEPPLNSSSTKERVCQILFETFNIPALSLINQGVLSLYASGQTSGTTIESGEGMTYFVPISDGCPLYQSTFQLDVASQDLTLYLLQLLTERGNLLVSTADQEYIRNVKEKCYVALDFDKEKVEDSNPSSCLQKFQLPDGQEISLGQGAFLCPEALFQTNLIGESTGRGQRENHPGDPRMAMQCITFCNPSLWKTLFGHIILSRGTGSCSGLRLRLQRELTGLASPTIDVKVPTSPYAKCGAWVGGSILFSLSTFKDMWVTSSEYRDVGCSIISRRSF